MPFRRYALLPLLVIVFLLLSFHVRSHTLIVSYGDHDTAPHTLFDDGRLVGGILKNIFDELAVALGVDVEYQNIPRNREESFIRDGKTHVLLSSPEFYPIPERYQWSLPLYEESGVFVVAAERPFSIDTKSDLLGKWVGTIRGYIYPGFTEAFRSGQIIRDDAESMAANFERLRLGYIDCLIDSDIAIAYYLKVNNKQSAFIQEDLVAGTHKVTAMISPLAPVSADQINAAFARMKEEGRVKVILDRYR